MTRPDTPETSRLLRDRSFVAFLATQFLGAFNDNAFKQLVLLIATDEARRSAGPSYQALATALFALPFLLFSGFAGSVADRITKTYVIRAAKVGEITIMLLGAVALASGSLALLLAVVFLMGTQSAFFGPAKYGILPEMLERRQLAPANGMVLMTTFLSIILGMAAAGWLRDLFGTEVHWCALIYLVLAAMGTLTAWQIRVLPAARPDIELRRKPLGDLLPTLRAIFRDRLFVKVVLASSFFWFLGGVVQQALNAFGRDLMGLSNTATSLLLVTLSAGMALGSLLGGVLSREEDRFRYSRLGLVGLFVALALLGWSHRSPLLTHAVLLLLGTSGGLYALPLQTFIQVRAEHDRRGRVVAAANFLNWIFIFLSAGYFAGARAILPISGVPLSLAVGVLLLGPWLIRRGLAAR